MAVIVSSADDPQPQQPIERPNVQAALGGWAEVAVTLVVAPAGYGKSIALTALLRGWIGRRATGIG
jgi:ATP/maltotriose-dependent transcriptional regulator MalT